MDNPFVSCPYDPMHRVMRSRLQKHIVKCEKVYPALSICPYNATHRLPHDKMIEHVVDCPTRKANFPQKLKTNKPEILTDGARYKPQPIEQKDYLPETDPDYEMWDD